MTKKFHETSVSSSSFKKVDSHDLFHGNGFLYTTMSLLPRCRHATPTASLLPLSSLIFQLSFSQRFVFSFISASRFQSVSRNQANKHNQTMRLSLLPDGWMLQSLIGLHSAIPQSYYRTASVFFFYFWTSLP